MVSKDGTVTIKITPEAWDVLKSGGSKGDTYSDVILSYSGTSEAKRVVGDRSLDSVILELQGWCEGEMRADPLSVKVYKKLYDKLGEYI